MDQMPDLVASVVVMGRVVTTDTDEDDLLALAARWSRAPVGAGARASGR